MIRRSFRFGLLLGLLGGAAFALTKVLGSRSAADVPSPAHLASEPWPPLVPDREATRPYPTTTPTDLPFVPDPAAPTSAGKAAPVKKAAVKKVKQKAPAKAWVEPKGGVCPTSHPVKGKLTSKIFHLPGMLNYERTNPDRCYLDEAKAEADGLRAAKR